MLTRCLQELEQNYIIIRKSKGSVPPSVTYELTDSGKELIPALIDLYNWGDIHQYKLVPLNKDQAEI